MVKSRVFNCQTCDKVYTRQSAYTRHLKQHSDPEYLKKLNHEYSCQLCGLVLKHQSNLYRHMKFQHRDNVKSYQCEICQKGFSNRSNLKIHQQIHDQNKEFYRCSVENCGRRFYSQVKLDEHIQLEHMKQSSEGQYSPLNNYQKEIQNHDSSDNQFDCSSFQKLGQQDNTEKYEDLDKYLFTQNDLRDPSFNKYFFQFEGQVLNNNLEGFEPFQYQQQSLNFINQPLFNLNNYNLNLQTETKQEIIEKSEEQEIEQLDDLIINLDNVMFDHYKSETNNQLSSRRLLDEDDEDQLDDILSFNQF